MSSIIIKQSPWSIFFLAFTSIIYLQSCSGSKKAITDSEALIFEETEEELLDTLFVIAPRMDDGEEIPQELPEYRASPTRHMNLLHTSLDLRFNWEKQQVIGLAEITMTPYFFPQTEIILDAKGFDIHKVEKNSRLLKYEYDGQEIIITLDREYTRSDTFTISINYTAHPAPGEDGGSLAIASDQGLFFINPLGEDPDKPMQIWTQGETEHNSRWFPTIDKPNERMSQQIRMTVEDRFATLSNGSLISSIKNTDGTRTDTWRQELPHAPYLAMVAVGEFSVVTEKWNGMDLMYYVEPEYRESAKEIFNHTPEMLDFFSSILRYPYPWDKYAQIVTRDYVSGAMENTSAVIFGEFVQKTKRELIDNDNDYIVAHEMFHHWFGDLVTCESWSNLTLQEGFANYSEYLWFEYKYGSDRAENHRLSQLEGYLMSTENEGTRPLIDFEYIDKEDMFDAHSYNKGGLVLHMLRDYLGDEAFFAGLHTYLKDNEYTAVEVHDLRLAFEKVTGIDLNWFFNQWFLSKGHPVLDVEYSYDEGNRELTITVNQVQNIEDHLPIYRLELDVALYFENGEVKLYPLSLTKRSGEYLIGDIDRPAVVVLDGQNTQLAVINEKKSQKEYLSQFKLSGNYADKAQAIRFLRNSSDFQQIIDLLLGENYYLFRKTGVEGINFRTSPEKIERLQSMITDDPHSAVREAALSKLANYDYSLAKPYILHVLDSEEAYPLVSAALTAIYNNERPIAIQYAIPYRDSHISQLTGILSGIFASHGDAEFLPFFENQLNSVSLFTMFNFYNKYFELVNQLDNDIKMNAVERMANIARHGNITFRRFAAMSFINRIKNSLWEDDENERVSRVQSLMDDIILYEKNTDLKERYRSF
ncbi:MAG TPA: M1 family aminopeptidase [Saprospiraceae bacterium]|nr:M1 family aminopeptidase [Saprospiraceae bacterium]